MNESKVVFCVEWGVSPLAYGGRCCPRMKVFNSAHDARDFFDEIDLRTIFEIAAEDRQALATGITAKKFCYVGERDAAERITPTVFLDRACYDYGAYAVDSLKRSELRW